MNTYSSMGEAEGAAMAHNARMAADLARLTTVRAETTPEPSAMSVPLSDTRPFGVVFDRPDADRNYAWGPFASFDTAARFAEFVEAEIDPAHVIPWADAQAIPGVRLLDPVAELLGWRESVAPEQAGSCPADCPCRQIPLTARWDNTVIHPNPADTEDTEDTETVACCVADGGQPVAVLLDDEQREALVLALLLPDGDGDIDPQHLELVRENERLRAELATAHADALNRGAAVLDHLADTAEAKVLEHYNGACGKGSCDMVRESARTLREMAATHAAPTA